MKSTILTYLSLVYLAMMSSSCGKPESSLASAETIYWDGIEVAVVVPPFADTTAQNTLGIWTFPYDVDSLVKSSTSNLLSFSNIDRFTVTSSGLVIVDPDSANNFANIESASVSLYTDKKNAPVTIASSAFNPAYYAPTLALGEDATADIISYFPVSGMTTIHYAVHAKLRKPVIRALTVKLFVSYAIHVNP